MGALQSALVAFDAAIKEKVALVCMMELASQRPAGERSLSFVDIATATRLPVEQVEWLLMRAMSVGLIRGSIDEVDQVVHVSYIKVLCVSYAHVRKHVLKGMACHSRVTPASSHASPCSSEALALPASHARGCANPLRA